MASVTIAQGKLKGAEAFTENGFIYYEFLSIPYAKPPVGDLRFKNPQPAESWEGERDATKSALENRSWQLHFRTKELIGSEDCLHLNVFTPKLLSESKLLPVMFFIHGGGFVNGNGIIKDEINPEFLVENDVVVVTINYRLNVFGFLSLDIPEASGNMGLKDQVVALEWVQKNIEQFGGDKDNITIFGISAGSASVEYLMLSPTTQGLFHKAILQSGSTINDWARVSQYDEIALNLAEKLGYNGSKDDKHELCEFLLAVPAVALAEAAVYVIEKNLASGFSFGFVPTVERIEEGAFLTIDPYTLLKEGKFAKVPVIRGFCNLEGAVMKMMKPSAVEEIMVQKSFVNFLPFELDVNDKEKYNTKLCNAYSETNSEDDTLALEFFGDVLFVAGVWLSSIFFARRGITQYVYKFSYDGKLSPLKNMLDIKLKGACHGDDSGYLFKMNSFLGNESPDDADIVQRSKMTKMWTNFAKSGNPTPNGSGDVGIEWPKFTETAKAYVNLDKEITIEVDYEPDRMAIFEEIYSKYEN